MVLICDLIYFKESSFFRKMVAIRSQPQVSVQAMVRPQFRLVINHPHSMIYMLHIIILSYLYTLSYIRARWLALRAYFCHYFGVAISSLSVAPHLSIFILSFSRWNTCCFRCLMTIGTQCRPQQSLSPPSQAAVGVHKSLIKNHHNYLVTK